jgi:hypothetical protein
MGLCRATGMRMPRQQQPEPLAASARFVLNPCAARLRKTDYHIQEVGTLIVGERKYSTKLGILRSKSTTHLHEKKFE